VESKLSFRIEIDGQYGENEGQITLYDDSYELVTWVSDEWEMDSSLIYVIAEAIRLGYEQGVEAIVERLNQQGYLTLKDEPTKEVRHNES
jgi:hypothetical protein